MIAQTADTVAALNLRARADRIADGQVIVERPVTLHNGMAASAGDIVVSRRHNRTLQIGTGWVKNGDRWRINTTHANGDITVQPAERQHASVRLRRAAMRTSLYGWDALRACSTPCPKVVVNRKLQHTVTVWDIGMTEEFPLPHPVHFRPATNGATPHRRRQSWQVAHLVPRRHHPRRRPLRHPPKAPGQLDTTSQRTTKDIRHEHHTLARGSRNSGVQPEAEARMSAARQEMADEMIAHSLSELRERCQTTQAQLATVLGITPASLSRREHSTDPRLSTIRDQIEALGGKLQILAEFEDDTIPVTIDS